MYQVKAKAPKTTGGGCNYTAPTGEFGSDGKNTSVST
jgi:hypothetical protein